MKLLCQWNRISFLTCFSFFCIFPHCLQEWVIKSCYSGKKWELFQSIIHPRYSSTDSVFEPFYTASLRNHQNRWSTPFINVTPNSLQGYSDLHLKVPFRWTEFHSWLLNWCQVLDLPYLLPAGGFFSQWWAVCVTDAAHQWLTLLLGVLSPASSSALWLQPVEQDGNWCAI